MGWQRVNAVLNYLTFFSLMTELYFGDATIEEASRVKNILKGNHLSKVGKEILIKAVAQAVPSNATSCFKLPDSLCEDIERLIRRFERKIHWVSWSKLCMTKKKEGGIGFRDLKAFNLALLAKQAWRIVTRPHSLPSRIFRAKYFP